MDDTNNLGRYARIGGHVVARRVGARIILIDMNSMRAFRLNESASEIWDQAVSALDLDDFVSAMSQRAGPLVDGISQRDIFAFVANLEKRGWLVIQEASSRIAPGQS